MPTPIYTDYNIPAAFHLRYTTTGWPNADTAFPPQPGTRKGVSGPTS